MKSIETDITVDTDGRASLDFALPAGVSPGIHRAVIVIEESVVKQKPLSERLNFTMHPVGPVPANSSYRREDIYGDDGR